MAKKNSSAPQRTDMTTIPAGTVLYHGTDNDAFEEADDGLDGPAWVSNSKAVAERFARRARWGGTVRIVTYRVAEDIELHEVKSERQLLALAEEFNLDLSGVEGMRESVQDACIPGWVVRSNYPDGGDDILLVNTGALDYVESVPCAPEKATR